MRVADTSFLYAFFNQKDTHHAEAVAWMADPEPLLIIEGVLHETLNLVQYRRGHDPAGEVARYLSRLPHVQLVPGPSLAQSRNIWSRFPKLSFTDAAGVAAAAARGSRLASFDEAQLAAHREL